MNKKEKIDNFLEELKRQDANTLNWELEGDIGDILKHFAITCKKCGSSNIFVSWEEGRDYSEYTGYSKGRKLFKCNNCGNAASFWE